MAKEPNTLALAFMSLGGLLAAAAFGWAAHGLLQRSAGQAIQPVTAATSPEVTPRDDVDVEFPQRVSLVTEDGVTLEESALVREFLDLSVRCGTFRGGEYRANLFDLFKLRSRDKSVFDLEYEIVQPSRNSQYVTVRERTLSKGKPLSRIPEYVAYTYYYDDARGTFSLESKAPDSPIVDPQNIYLPDDPLSFLIFHWEAVCNNKLIHQKARARQAQTRTQAQTAPLDPTPQTGLSQFADGDSENRGAKP